MDQVDYEVISEFIWFIINVDKYDAFEVAMEPYDAEVINFFYRH